MESITLTNLILNFVLGSIFLIRGYLLVYNKSYNFNFLKKLNDNLTITNNVISKQKIIRGLGFLYSFFGLFMLFLPIYYGYIGKISFFVVIPIPIIAAAIYYIYIVISLKKESKINK